MSPLVNMLALYHPSIPTIIFGSLSITSGSLGFLLPETRRKELPESIREAEHNGYVHRSTLGQAKVAFLTEYEGTDQLAPFFNLNWPKCSSLRRYVKQTNMDESTGSQSPHL